MGRVRNFSRLSGKKGRVFLLHLAKDPPEVATRREIKEGAGGCSSSKGLMFNVQSEPMVQTFNCSTVQVFKCSIAIEHLIFSPRRVRLNTMGKADIDAAFLLLKATKNRSANAGV